MGIIGEHDGDIETRYKKKQQHTPPECGDCGCTLKIIYRWFSVKSTILYIDLS
jgi:ribosomal protein L34E